MATLAAVAGVATFVALTDGGRLSRAAVPVLPDIEPLLTLAGFGLDQISLSGQRFTADTDVLDALDLRSARTWASFDDRAARDRIEKLPWVATATLTRIYPGRLDVRVSERKAFAVWEHGDRVTLIDVTGRSLSDVRAGTVVDLPRVKGFGADVEAAALLAITARHPIVHGRLRLAERVAGRRWTLHLDNGTLLHLPADREQLVLDSLLVRARLLRLVTEPGRIVDLRAAGRIAVRSRQGHAAAMGTRAGATQVAAGRNLAGGE